MSYFDQLTNTEKATYEVIDIGFNIFLSVEVRKYRNQQFQDPRGLKIENKVFTSNAYFNGVFEFALQFDNCYFQKDAAIYKATFRKSFSISHCFFDGELRLHDNIICEADFNIVNLSTPGQVYVHGGKYERCRWSLANASILKVGGGEFRDLNIGYWGNASFNTVDLSLRNLKGHINIGGIGTTIRELSLSNFAPDVSIAIENVEVNYLSLYMFKNEKGFRMVDVRSRADNNPSEFSIYSSSLGKAEFYSIDLNSFDHVYWMDSQFVDCSFVNIDWKFDIRAFKGRRIHQEQDEIELKNKIDAIERWNWTHGDIDELKKDENVIKYYRKLKETYRQLKYALSKQGDSINEQKFHTREMLAYNRVLNIERNLGTKLIVNFSYAFSDFGQSIARPFVALLIGHWILLIILIGMGGISGLTLNVFNGSAEGFKEGFHYYFKLINPLRKTDDIGGYAIAVDIFMRIWASYMLYNIVRATRRFIK